MIMEHCALLSIENQVIVVISCTLNRHTKKALKDSITYSQALRIKPISSKTSEVTMHLKDLKNVFSKRGYQSKILDNDFQKAISVDPKTLLENKEKPSTQGNLPLVFTFNKTLSSIKNLKDKHWHILTINENLWKVFNKRPFIPYRRNTNIQQLIGGNRIFKVVRKNTKQLNNQNNQETVKHATQE